MCQIWRDVMATRTTKTTAKPTKTATKPKVATATAKKAAVAKPQPALKTSVTAPKATVVEVTKPLVAAPLIKKPELIDRIVAESGLKKKDVKPVVEATLAVLARALVNGEELQVPPLGKVKINQMKDVANAKIIKLKVRHQMSALSPDDPAGMNMDDV